MDDQTADELRALLDPEGKASTIVGQDKAGQRTLFGIPLKGNFGGAAQGDKQTPNTVLDSAAIAAPALAGAAGAGPWVSRALMGTVAAKGAKEAWDEPKKNGVPLATNIGLNLLLSKLGMPPTAAGALAGAGTSAARELVDPSDGIPQAGAKLLLDMGIGGAGGALGGAMEAPILRGERNLQATATYGAEQGAYKAAEQSRARAGNAATVNVKKQLGDLETGAAATPTYNQRPNSPAWVKDANKLAEGNMAFVNSAAKAFNGDPQKFATYMELPESKMTLRKLFPDTTQFDERHAQLSAFLKRANSPMPPEPTAPTMERSPLLNAKHAMNGPISHFIGHTPTKLVMAAIPTSDIVQKFMTSSPAFRAAALDWANTGALRIAGGYGGQAFANWFTGNATTKVDKPQEQQDVPNLRKLLEP